MFPVLVYLLYVNIITLTTQSVWWNVCVFCVPGLVTIVTIIKEIPEESDAEGAAHYGGGAVHAGGNHRSNSNLVKIAEAAGRKMKKLKTNWSIKKSDITRSLSRIKKTSRPALDLGPAPDGQ